MNYIPATTAMSRYKGDDGVNRIEILASSVEAMPDSEPDQQYAHTDHRGIKDFEIRTQDEQMEELKSRNLFYLFA